MYSDSKNPFHTNPKCDVRSAPPYSMEILLEYMTDNHLLPILS